MGETEEVKKEYLKTKMIAKVRNEWRLPSVFSLTIFAPLTIFSFELFVYLYNGLNTSLRVKFREKNDNI